MARPVTPSRSPESSASASPPVSEVLPPSRTSSRFVRAPGLVDDTLVSRRSSVPESVTVTSPPPCWVNIEMFMSGSIAAGLVNAMLLAFRR